MHKTAYCYQSIFGEEYYTSARKGFIINLKHNSRIFLANSYAEFYISICKIFIVVLNVLISWFVGVLSRNRNDFIEILVPIFATMVSTYLLCFSILGLYDEVVLSIITCV